MNNARTQLFKLAIGVCLLVCLCLGGQAALGEATAPPELICLIYEGENTAQIHAQLVMGDSYLFLPACADLSDLRLSLSGDGLWAGSETGEASVLRGGALDLTALFPDGPDAEGIYLLDIAAEKGAESQPLRIMHSANIASLFVLSDDPVNAGRSYVESAEKFNKLSVTGSVTMLNARGQAVYDGAMRELRGRGNATWNNAKKPYQIKLGTKCDLLESGNDLNRQRTWVLLAEAIDPSFLHNTIALALGQALGLQSTPEFRPVDLYYDGEYIGLYTLCERVQVKPGRLNIADTQDYMESLYPMLEDTKLYPRVVATDAKGREYKYTQGIDIALESRAAYLLEMDCFYYIYGDSWFNVDKDVYFELRNPANASEKDVLYVSQLMYELIETVENGGIHPTTGLSLSDYLDLDSMVRVILVQQYVKNIDFGYTSTFFYLPVGERRFYAGPLWDFDWGYSVSSYRINSEGVSGCITLNHWVGQLLTLPEVQAKVQEIYDQDFSPLIAETLLADGDVQHGALRSMSSYIAERERSAAMDYHLWYGAASSGMSLEDSCQTLKEYLSGRYDWLCRDVPSWLFSEITDIGLDVYYINARVLDNIILQPHGPHRKLFDIGDIEWSVEPLAEGGATYTAVIQLTAHADAAFMPDATARMNLSPMEVLSLDEKSATVRIHFNGPLYTEAIYDDVDYGLLFQYSCFAQRYPEAIEECGDDPQAALEYYVDYYLPEGLSAIETFDYDAFYAYYQATLDENYMGDIYMSTMHYLDYAESQALLGLGEVIYPD